MCRSHWEEQSVPHRMTSMCPFLAARCRGDTPLGSEGLGSIMAAHMLLLSRSWTTWLTEIQTWTRKNVVVQSINPTHRFHFICLCYVMLRLVRDFLATMSRPPSGSILILELNRKVQFYCFSLFYIFVLYKMCYNKSLDQYLYIIICIKHLHLQQKKSKSYGIKWY